MGTMGTAVRIAPLLLLFLFNCAPLAEGEELVDHHGSMVPVRTDPPGCIVCHDGTIASGVSFCTVECNFRGSHAVAKAYPPPGKEAKYVPQPFVERSGITFLDNKVVCTSCHNLRNPESLHLAVPIANSQLCFSCHIK